jgi:hypothetical protein
MRCVKHLPKQPKGHMRGNLGAVKRLNGKKKRNEAEHRDKDRKKTINLVLTINRVLVRILITHNKSPEKYFF